MDVLSREYRLLYVEQKEIVKERLIAVVVDSLDSLSEVVCAQLLSIAQSNAPTQNQANQELVQAQNVVQEAGRVYGQQLASTLTQGLNSLNILPTATAGSVASNQPTADAVSISGSQPQVNASTNQINDVNEDSDDEEMSVKSEINSDDECLSDSDSQPDVEVKEEPEENQIETEINPTAAVKDEIVSSSECESDTDSDEYESDSVQVKEEEEDEIRFVHNSINQDPFPDGSANEESENFALSNGNVETANSSESNNEHQADEMMMDDEANASSEPGQAGPSTASNTAFPLTRRSTRATAAKKVSHSEAVWNSLTEQKGTLQTGIRKRKRSTGRSGKSNAPKRTRARASQAPTVSAEETDDSEDDEDDPEPEAISLSVIVRRLKCRVPGCKKVFPGKLQLDGHLLAKHGIEKYACKVKDCTESYATRGELKAHRDSAHDNLDNEWPCGQCELTCPSYQKLWIHINHFHEYGLFSCSADKCDYTEKTRIKVQNHQQTHRPAKYRCTFAGCASSFNKKSNLTAHSRVHSKEKPFPCSQCPKAFALKQQLTLHERTHSGLKPYSCTWPHCDFSASGQSDVIKHIRGVHFGLPRSKTEQAKRGIIDACDARLFLKKTASTGN